MKFFIAMLMMFVTPGHGAEILDTDLFVFRKLVAPRANKVHVIIAYSTGNKNWRKELAELRKRVYYIQSRLKNRDIEYHQIDFIEYTRYMSGQGKVLPMEARITCGFGQTEILSFGPDISKRQLNLVVRILDAVERRGKLREINDKSKKKYSVMHLAPYPIEHRYQQRTQGINLFELQLYKLELMYLDSTSRSESIASYFGRIVA